MPTFLSNLVSGAQDVFSKIADIFRISPEEQQKQLVGSFQAANLFPFQTGIQEPGRLIITPSPTGGITTPMLASPQAGATGVFFRPEDIDLTAPGSPFGFPKPGAKPVPGLFGGPATFGQPFVGPTVPGLGGAGGTAPGPGLGGAVETQIQQLVGSGFRLPTPSVSIVGGPAAEAAAQQQLQRQFLEQQQLFREQTQTARFGGVGQAINLPPSGLGGQGAVVTGFSSAGAPVFGLPTAKPEEEEERRKRGLITRDVRTGQLIPPPGFSLVIGEGGGTFLRSQTTGELFVPQADRFGREFLQKVSTGFAAGAAPGTLDLAGMQTRINEISRALASPGVQTSAQALSNFQDILQGFKAQLDAQAPTPPQGLVQETPSQIAAIAFSPDPLGLRQQMDQRRQELGLPSLEGQRLDLMKTIHATVQAFRKIVEDIHNNPELPASLARRRIEMFTRENARILEDMQGQLGLIQAEIKQRNDLLDRDFQITRLEREDREREKDNARQFINILISSRSIAQADDASLARLAAQAGVSPSLLQSAKRSAQEVLEAMADRNEEARLRAEERLNISLRNLELRERGVELREQAEVRRAQAGQPFLSTQWFMRVFPVETLFEQARAVGIPGAEQAVKDKTGTQRAGVVVQYLKNLMSSIQAYRDAGFSDQDILKMIQAKK